MIGDIYVAHGNRTVEKLLAAVVTNWDFSALDQLAGRFALFVSRPDGMEIFHDPFGSRTIYYATNLDFCLSSHAALCAQASGQLISPRMKKFTALPDYKKRGTVFLPGDLTMYENILCLTPNCCFKRGQGVKRYWPRDDLAPASLEQFMSVCDEYFANTASFLNSKYNMVLGLTGGVDTRTIIAGLMETGSKVDLVTWTGRLLPENEKPAVEEMIRHLGSKHTYMNPANKDWDDQAIAISKAINAATGYCRGGSRLTVNMYEVCGADDVFVRGYGGEIIRGFFNRYRAASREGYKPISTEDCVEVFTACYKTKKIMEPDPLFLSVIQEATEGFVERTNYIGAMHGFDVLDLFYWEQRMGNWGANMLNEMDPAVYSFVGLNSRPLFQTAFGLPRDYRLGTKLMLDITARYDNQFAKIGVIS